MSTTPTRGSGTTFWRLNDGVDITTILDTTADDDWSNIAKIKEIQPGEITAEDIEDNYLDSEHPDWVETSSGQKSAGETQVTLAWLPGDAAQQKLVDDFNSGQPQWWRIKYPNNVVDCYYGYINSLGKTVQVKERMQRTIKIKNIHAPKMAEDLIA